MAASSSQMGVWRRSYSCSQHHDCFEFIEPLLASELSEAPFRKWFSKLKPDVVLCHNFRVWEWMENAGAKVPKTHGFCCLNVTMSEKKVAGLDLQPRLIGSRAMELIIAQLHRNEYGIPETASTTTIPAAWTDGPTLRGVINNT
ncbi:MAG: hypothetical protein ACREIA_24865 [Opitutaceae bacterium]